MLYIQPNGEGVVRIGPPTCHTFSNVFARVCTNDCVTILSIPTEILNIADTRGPLTSHFLFTLYAYPHLSLRELLQ